MKKHNTLKVVLITLFVFFLLSWILPKATYMGYSGYQGQYSALGRYQIGLFDIFNYPTLAVSYFAYIAMFVFAIGMFYGVLNKISAYRVLIDKLVKAFKGKEIIVISTIMTLFAIITSICGLQVVLLFTFPFVISLVLAMGYDKIVAAFTTVGSVVVGMIGTTFAYNNVVVLLQYLSLKVTNGIWYKIIIFVICLGLLILNTILYINKKSKKSKEDKKDLEKYIPAEVSTKGKKVRVWPLVLILDLVLVISILGFMPWSTLFNITLFEDVTNAITGFTVPAYIALIVLVLIINLILVLKKKIRNLIVFDSAVGFVTIVILVGRFLLKAKLFISITNGLSNKFSIFGKALGSVNPFGSWTVPEITALLLISAIVLAIIYKIKTDDIFDGMLGGAKKAFVPVLLVILLYAGLVMCFDINGSGTFQLVIYKGIFSITKGFNIFTSAIVAFLSTIFNSEPYYAFASVTPYLTSLVTNVKVYNVIEILYQSISGLTLFVAPTSLILIVTLHYLEIPYLKWLKSVWKLVLEMLAVILIICLIML